MFTLAIETSGRSGTVALARDNYPTVERSLAEIGRRHAQTLVTEIARLFDDGPAALHDCELVAVSIGPGSFTGLRVGVVCAKTLAYVTGARLAAVDTFECVAENSPEDVDSVFVVSDAQRGGLFVGRYVRQALEVWQRDGDISIADSSEWCQARSASDVISGWGVEKVFPTLDGRCRILDRKYWTPTAATVARAGCRLALRGDLADCMTLEPFYLRRSAAEEKAGET